MACWCGQPRTPSNAPVYPSVILLDHTQSEVIKSGADLPFGSIMVDMWHYGKGMKSHVNHT